MPSYNGKKLLCEISKRVYERKYVVATDGNISLKLDKDNILITPRGVSLGFMEPKMIVNVNEENSKVSLSDKQPSSELKIHLMIYKQRKDINAVIHAHPPYATAFAVAGVPLTKKILPETIVNLGSIPLAKYATPSTKKFSQSINNYLDDYNAVLLENHGVLCWGKDLKQAYFLLETLEFNAKMLMLLRDYPEIELSNKEIDKLREVFE